MYYCVSGYLDVVTNKCVKDPEPTIQLIKRHSSGISTLATILIIIGCALVLIAEVIT